jgi:hypothetical protein
LNRGGHFSTIDSNRPVHFTYFEQSDGYGRFTPANKHGRGNGHNGVFVVVISVVDVVVD